MAKRMPWPRANGDKTDKSVEMLKELAFAVFFLIQRHL